MRWFNPSHPQTMQAAVFIGYISGLFALLFSAGALSLLPALLMIGGAFGMANNKKVGWIALLVGASLYALLRCLNVLVGVGVIEIGGFGASGLNPTLAALNGVVFPIALVVAVVHPHTRSYMKAWFE